MAYLDQDEDTICALATPSGVSGIAVIRLSGDRSVALVRECCRFFRQENPSHRASVGLFRNREGSRVIDEVVVTYFEEGKSYTGEEVVEISCHGNPVIVSEILGEIVDLGARLALPGEFTFRAFKNGRMDLVQAESVLSLMEARSARIKEVAVEQLRGRLSERVQVIRSKLINLAARIEVNLDLLSDEIVGTSASSLKRELILSQNEILELLASFQSGRILNEGFRVVLVGEPNVGKSSLLNALVGEERSIVTEIPGTTRDVVEKEIVSEGVRIIFCDTAGLHETEDVVERLGIQRSYEEIRRADLVLHVIENGSDEKFQFEEKLSAKLWSVRTKSDLMSNENWRLSEKAGVFVVSSKMGWGIDQLKKEIAKVAVPRDPEECLIVINARQASLLSRSLERMRAAVEVCENQWGEEILAFEVGQVIRCLCEMLGEEFNDQVINEIFGQFCVGK